MTVKEAILILNTNVIVACERARFDSATIRMVEDALDTIEDTLQTQKPMKPKKVKRYTDFDGEGHPYTPETYDCSACSNELPWKANYCPKCGQKIKWK